MVTILRQELSQIGQNSQANDSRATKTPALEQNPAPHTSIVAQNSQNVKHKQSHTAPKPCPAPIFLGSPKHQLASFCPVCFPGLDAERLIYRLESRGVLVSTGAACAANKGSKSHVLAAIGLSDTEIAGSLRISLGSTNTIEQIRQAAVIIREEIEREYERIGVKEVRTVNLERIEEQPAGCEERAPRKDGRARGSREVNSTDFQEPYHA